MILYLHGGMGNQKFEYAAARAYQLRFAPDKKLVLNIGRMKGMIGRIGGTPRDFEIGRLSIANRKVLPRWRTLLCDIAFMMRRIPRNLREKRLDKRLPQQKVGIFRGNSIYGFTELEESKRVGIFFKGYFQNFRYFSGIEEELRSEFAAAGEPSAENAAILQDIQQSESVCVHIRRGDYLNPEWSFLNICNEQYYRDAMKMIAERVAHPVFYVFSNAAEEVEWIRENYHLGDYDIRYMTQGNCVTKDYRLMCACRHFVISNSTLSWWVQFMGTAPDKIVAAPPCWHLRGNDNATDALYMENWNLISVGLEENH